MNPFFSLCMIVKDESAVLRRCLESVTGLIDEIVVVDTGSMDNTKDIASEFTSLIFDYRWNNDFSKARNFAASKASGQWILVLDADEYVERSNLRAAIEEIKSRNEAHQAYVVNIINFLGENGTEVDQHKSPRIYRNNGKIKFERSIHEQLAFNGRELKNYVLSSLNVYHTGYMNKAMKEKNKVARNINLTSAQLNKKANNAFDMLNHGNELAQQGEYDEALKWYIKAYKAKEGTHLDWVPSLLRNTVQCLIALKRYDDALNVAKDAEQVYGTIVDFTFYKGQIYLLQHDLTKAQKVLLEVVRSDKKAYTSPDIKEYLPYKLLGHISELEKQYEDAVKYYISALNNNKYCITSSTRLIKLFSRKHNENEIYTFFSEKLFNHNEQYMRGILRFALNQGLTTFVNLLVQDYYAQDEMVGSIVDDKLKIVEGRYTPEVPQMKTLLAGMKLSIVDTADLLIYFLEMEDENIREQLQKVIHGSNLSPILALYQNNQSEVPVDKEGYLYLLNKLIQFKKIHFIGPLIDLISHHASDLVGVTGDTFFEQGFEDLAIDFYLAAADGGLTEQGYKNMTEWLKTNENHPEAQRVSLIVVKG